MIALICHPYERMGIFSTPLAITYCRVVYQETGLFPINMVELFNTCKEVNSNEEKAKIIQDFIKQNECVLYFCGEYTRSGSCMLALRQAEISKRDIRFIRLSESELRDKLNGSQAL